MVSLPTGNWHYPTTMHFGVGRISELAEICHSLGIERPLIVTDPGLADLPMITDVLHSTRTAGLKSAVFSDIKPNPVGRNVTDGAAVYRDGEHDGIVAFGGGSSLDAGKAVALMAGQNRPLWDFEDVGDNWTRADARKISPIIAVPTTSGTGSEVGRAAVITNEDTCRKLIVFHPKMMPDAVVCDPVLATGLPPGITAATGMDALAHCLEAYSASEYHPMADGIAVEGIRLVRDWLTRAVDDGSDLEARSHMMSASAMGATAFQKGLGAIHALSHPVGALHDTHHGLTNAVFMPYVMQFNRSAIEERFKRLAQYLGHPKPGFSSVFDWIMELRDRFNVPHTSAELGIEESEIEEIARMAEADPSIAGNPVPAGAAEMRQILEASLAGRL